jgi:hypothetical protein
MSADPIPAVKRELLIRQLDSWAPAALHRSRRATFVQAYAGPDDGTVDAVLRVFAEFADLLRGRRLAVVALAAQADDLAVRLGAGPAELPAGVSVHVVPGDLDRLPVALRAAGAAGAPVLAYLDAAAGPAPTAATLAAVAAGRPGELLLVLGPRARAELEHRRALREAGFPLVTDVELVAGEAVEPQLVVFATATGKSLDAFKDAMWAVDEYAGVRYRDPGDPEGHLLDISLSPHPGPLRRELLAHLAEVGPSSVTALRQFTVTATVYRAADTNRALTALLAAGQVIRSPEQGRLAGDVIIEPGAPAAGRSGG